MRGPDIQQDTLFSTASPESRVPKDHPLRPIRTMVDQALAELDADFNALYSDFGRDSIPPEKLLRAQLLMALYTIRSERQLVEQINYNLLFRWFVGFSMDDVVWNHSTFTKNRDRLLGGEIARRFFAQVLGQAEQADLLSKEHFSVDGTMLEALASLKSYRPKDEDDGPPGGGGRNPTVDFRGERRSRDTHDSKTDKDAYLYKKSKRTAAKLSYLGHLLMENRHGLVVDAQVTQATGTAETVHRRSMGAPPAMRGMPSANACTNALRNAVAGPRPSVGCAIWGWHRVSDGLPRSWSAWRLENRLFGRQDGFCPAITNRQID